MTDDCYFLIFFHIQQFQVLLKEVPSLNTSHVHFIRTFHLQREFLVGEFKQLVTVASSVTFIYFIDVSVQLLKSS